MKVVIVESPSKAKTINKYLGSDYEVIASYGHIRDLPSKNGSVLPEEGFSMSWETDERNERHIKDIVKLAAKADQILLATDPDREGEAISWHVLEVLKERGVLKNQDVKRIVFHEITKTAVIKSIQSPRELNGALVDSYLARRALDYLVGFTLSPVLWRKLPGSRSAGRVQSVALRLICDREGEIESFISEEYWSIDTICLTETGENFRARLLTLNNEKVEKFTFTNQAAAQQAQADILGGKPYTIQSVEKKQIQRHPAPPFTTSTLQQEASRKLGFSASKTMQVAQKLYEGIEIGGDVVGLITYMRTDSVVISGEAIAQCRGVINSEFGEAYLPSSPRVFKTKAKNAQEAHEGIRPTSLSRVPKDLSFTLETDQLKLYDLIWKRMMASQMSSALFDQVTADIASLAGTIELRAVGTTRKFDGFLKLYEEGKDESGDEADARKLPPLSQGDTIVVDSVLPEQHFTQPPPRYTEASLVKKMEELGIGRPSTYASILHVLQDRHYVHLEKKTFIPDDRGRLVTSFLANYFLRYVEYSFTADLEDQLDDISSGKLQWKNVLTQFWDGFTTALKGTSDLKISDVLESLNQTLSTLFFPPKADGTDPRACPQCATGKLSLKLGKYGAFIGCSDYPECTFTRRLEELKLSSEDESSSHDVQLPKLLGVDKKNNLSVSIRKGPYGPYLQWGDEQTPKENLKRVPLPKNLAVSNVTLEQAEVLGQLPRTLGSHPETGQDVLAGIGRFGPYVKHQAVFASLKKDDDVLTVTLDRALALLAIPKAPRPQRGKKTAVEKEKAAPAVKSKPKTKSATAKPKTAKPKAALKKSPRAKATS